METLHFSVLRDSEASFFKTYQYAEGAIYLLFKDVGLISSAVMRGVPLLLAQISFTATVNESIKKARLSMGLHTLVWRPLNFSILSDHLHVQLSLSQNSLKWV